MITIKNPESSYGAYAKLTIFDFTGRAVKTLVSGPVPSGYFITEWNCTNDSGIRVSPGTYLMVWEQGDSRMTEKLVVIQ